VRLRLHGTPTEVAATLAVLPEVLKIADTSPPYPDRPLSTYIRVYLDAAPQTITDATRQPRGTA
jgi:hypothetical protein